MPVKELNDLNFDEVVNKEEKLVVVEFYTVTCPNCRAVEPEYNKMAEELGDKAIFCKINASYTQSVSMRFGIMGVPTFKFFCKGQPIGELVGAVYPQVLKKTIEDMANNAQECAEKSTKVSFQMDGYQ